ncbi:MAG: hypothetical protein WCB85_14025 [Candidatus Dormiibacterota bacterium]
MVMLYHRDGRDVAELLSLVASIYEAPCGDAYYNAREALIRWAGGTDERPEAARRLRAIIKEIATQLQQ